MSLLSPEQIAKLAEKGLSPDANHKPGVLLETKYGGKVIGGFLLTHINPEHENEAYGLIDFGIGKPRMSMIFLNKLQSYYAEYNYHVSVYEDFEAEYPVSVYARAAQKKGVITTDKDDLQKAHWDLVMQKARSNFKSIIRGDEHPEGPDFLTFTLD